MGNEKMNSRTCIVRILVLITVALATILICPFLGIFTISLSDLVSNEKLYHVFMMIRIPRTLAAFIAGGGLAVGGMVYQALFRNPLASPYTLGVSGGASLGAALCIALGISTTIAGLSAVMLGAFAGAILAVFVVYSFAWSPRINSATLLLAGVVVATVCSGCIMFVYYISPLQHSYQIMRWIMGGIDGTTYSFLLVMAVPVLIYICYTAVVMPQLDQFLTGDSLAHSRGINVKRSRNTFIVATAMAVGAIVAVCGPVGFVGIMAPHACRMMFPGSRHRLLAGCSFLAGGILLTISDTLARTLAPPAEIPVGIFTALFGGPFFLILLFKRKARLY
ncbi:MAG: iron chelate uptake ABC transporter family permease subunit, partial [Chitinivibrionales bacterium]|nr:iron chelate uptake ABC transporter family permease subunit [Chitinivibrionales bacterium]